jgi:hypothetical protein
MAKYPLYLLLLLSLLRISDVQAACYAGSWTNGMPVYGSLYVTGGTTLGQCQALACQIYPNIQGCPQTAPQAITCTYSAQTETRLCPINQSGTQIWKKETNCPNGSYGQPAPTDWFKIQDSCAPNPPSCQVSAQTQTLSCQTGYVGSITQTQSSTCPNPYGQPIWSGSWITTQNTCTKSVTNPTNIASPVSPVSPLNPTNVATPVSPTVTSTVTAPTTQDVPNSEATLTTSQTKSTASETPTPKSNIFITPLGLSLGLLSKELTQPNVFPSINISQELPNDIKIMQQTYMDLITNGSLFYPNQTDKLNRIVSDAVELEQ